MKSEQTTAPVTAYDRERLLVILADYRKQHATLTEQVAMARGCVLAVEAQIQHLAQQAAPETGVCAWLSDDGRQGPCRLPLGHEGDHDKSTRLQRAEAAREPLPMNGRTEP